MREDRVPVDDLLEDVLAAQTCDPELVLRYEREPGALSAQERAEVEAWLASPANRDALGAMRRLRASGLESRSAIPLDPRQPRAAAPGHRRRGLRRAALLLAAGAAALLALVLLTRDPAPSGQRLAQQNETPAPLPEPAPVQPPAEQPAPPAPGPPAAPPSPAEPPRSPAAPPAAAPTPTPDRPHAPARPTAQPVLLALAMPRYEAPPGGPQARLDSVLRGTGNGARPVAISPDHVGRASRTSPVLYWYLPALPAPGTAVWLSVVDPAAEQTLLDVALPPPGAPGLQTVDLAERARLAAGIDYTWSVSLRPDPERPSLDEVAFGWIRHEPPPSAAAQRIATAAPGARPAIWAELGYFYDAFAELDELARAYPADPRVRAAQAELLRQANLEPAQLGLEE